MKNVESRSYQGGGDQTQQSRFAPGIGWLTDSCCFKWHNNFFLLFHTSILKLSVLLARGLTDPRLGCEKTNYSANITSCFAGNTSWRPYFKVASLSQQCMPELTLKYSGVCPCTSAAVRVGHRLLVWHSHTSAASEWKPDCTSLLSLSSPLLLLENRSAHTVYYLKQAIALTSIYWSHL